ncbi:MAG: aldehyde dehydrogenase family protein [Deltaproteobacteria bacterium]|nr:aldehyde dehydrogenase family protein [Deltaproteobacteria bacterium]
MPSYAFPAPPPTIAPTPLDECDRIAHRLAARRASFAALDIPGRIALLDTLLARTAAAAPEWARLGMAAKGHDPERPESGEEWLGGPVVTLRNMRLLRDALRETAAHGAPRVPADRITNRADGRTVVRVFPDNLLDKLMYGGFSAEVWMMPGVTRENLAAHQAGAYRERDTAGRVALVLGAGNVSSIPPMDAVYKLFVENQVVLLKMNPVNEYLGPIFREIFLPLVEKGWFEVVYGAAEVGAFLCAHPAIDTIHITGSDATHDAIVWGPADCRAARKASGEKQVDKPISSELGNVTPVLVVPGPWTDAEIQFQAESIATMVANNASFNCNAAKLLVLPAGWDRGPALLDAIRRVLGSLPNRKAYYPGARDRWKAFLDAHPEAERLTPDADHTVPWTLITGLDAGDANEICFTSEPFCGVLHVVELPGKTAVEFLPGAVDFCNAKVWGTLACMVLVHPSTRKDPASEAAFQDALDELRYGGIGVNHWAALNYALVVTTWGAFPGHTLEDIQSGRDVVHNTWLFDKPEKSVVYGPFTAFPKPAWFVTNRRTHRIAPKMAAFEAAPSLWKLPGIVLEAIRG